MSGSILIKDYISEKETLKKEIKYCENAISHSDTEDWEKKEYKQVIIKNEKRIKEIDNILEEKVWE